MLARGPPAVYIYFSPQNSLRPTILNRLPTGRRVSKPIFRRWQSAAASQVDVEHVEEPETRNDEQPQRPKPARSSRKFKIWRPSTDLGVNTLGKPADILVIPSRDRKIRQAPKTEGEGKIGSTLQEKLASENVPLDAKQLHENIEHARSLLDKRRGQLERHEWKTLRTQLKRGFKTEQLADYVRLKKPNFDSSVWPKLPEKDKVIRYLVEEVWGFTIPIKDTSSALPTQNVKQSTVSIRLRTSFQLDHLLRHPTQPLQKIVEEFGVQVDIDRSRLRIKISGPASGQLVTRARGRVVPFTVATRSITIPLEGLLGLISQDRNIKDRLDSCIPLIQQRHPGVTISWDEKNITLTHTYNPRGAEQVRRDILLSFPPPDNARDPVIWPHLDESGAMLQPFPAPRDLPFSLRGLEWLRFVSSDAAPQTSTRDNCKDSFTAIMQELREGFNFSSAVRHATKRSNLYSEVFANFGQTLIQVPSQPVEYDAHQQNLEQDNVTSDASAETRPMTKDDQREGRLESPPVLPGTRVFDAGAPFLAQNLASMDRWSEKPNTDDKDIPGNALVILRLELCPPLTKQALPSFELFVVAAHNPKNEKQLVLKVARISAILQEECATVVCPYSETDVNFTRHLKRDLVYPGFSGKQDVAILNSALCKFIDHARPSGRSDWVFEPFVTLQIPDSIRYAEEASLQKSEGDTSTEETSEVNDESIEYVLRTVDVMDIDSRQFPTHSTSTDQKKQPQPRSNLCLEHITYTGADAMRQELRLAQTPVLHAPSQKQVDLPSFVKAALTLAERLSHNPLKPQQKPPSLADQIDQKDLELAQRTINAPESGDKPPRSTENPQKEKAKASTQTTGKDSRQEPLKKKEQEDTSPEPTTKPKPKSRSKSKSKPKSKSILDPQKPAEKPKQTIKRLGLSSPR